MAAAEGIYRQSMICECLLVAVEEMVNEQKMTEDLALQAMRQFDKSVEEALANRVSARATIKGNIKTYRYCDNLWTFTLKDGEVKVNPSGSGTMSSIPAMQMGPTRVMLLDKDLGIDGQQQA